ncbi:good for full DBP5 activity protein 2 [Podospora aff. communis PSN243]|uniref:Good for full DBP5 activity protein 2 n=1 Tax=Podospora aff. communis PSN243 TaxID=3040156 RepID=A0AAV9H9U3_9PEZI|nr:good for full DBP5 activity protein 2 [Podospora aff. communis PSN243]
MDPNLQALLVELTGQPDLLKDMENLSSSSSEWENPNHSPATAGDNSWGPSTHINDDDDGPNETGSADMVFGSKDVDDEEETSKAFRVGKALPRHIPLKLSYVGSTETGLKCGDASKEGERFCPWKLVISYCDCFVGKVNGEKARRFFTLEGLHENRVWDLYYVHRPDAPNSDPYLFVPTDQFEHLLESINKRLGIALSIPGGTNSKKFEQTFGFSGTPRPRFLGRSTSVEVFRDLTEEYPPYHLEDNLENATHLGREFFLDQLLSIANMGGKKKKNSETARLKRIKTRRGWGQSMKRVQRYLGLRKAKHATNTSQATGNDIQALDLDRPLDMKPEGPVRFVAIDIEAYEHNQDLITEVGVAILDADKLVGVAPGDNGKNWHSLIEARHFRVKENTWAVNRDYVHGCPDFFSFGNSEKVPVVEIPALLQQIIDEAEAKPGDITVGGRRPVVLVFHESSADTKYLRTLGYRLFNAPNVIEVVDTRELNSFNTRDQGSSALERVLRRLVIYTEYLHNAGNDAVYTLQALISLAVERRLYSLACQTGEETKTHIPFSELTKGEGWSSGGEDSDGGEAVAPIPDYEDVAYYSNEDAGGW